MRWNLQDIQFLFQPDVFAGTFDSPQMQARHQAMQKEKISALRTRLEAAKDPIEAMLVLEKPDHIPFLFNNIEIFRQEQRYEKAVFHLFFRKNTPFNTDGDYSVWKNLLNDCDPSLLYAAGNPLPSEGKMTVYRGSVTGIVTGLCWTPDTQKVRWFLDRWSDKSMGGGTIYAMEITRVDILCFISDSKRQDLILKPEIAERAQPKIISAL